MRAAVFLAVVAMTFFVMQDDDAGESNEQQSVDSFARSAIGTSDKQQIESSAVVSVDNSEVIELHNLANVSNKRKSLLELNDELAFKIFAHYRGAYEFCENRFGVKKLWPGRRYS
jgi:hypothetical protein